MFLTPSTELTTFSIGLMTSFSIASGEAPGYVTVMNTCGMLISGICSTGSNRYENSAEHDQREHDHGREDGLIDAGAGDPHKKD